MLYLPPAIYFYMTEEKVMETGKIDNTDSRKGSVISAVEEYLLTVSHSDSFFGNEINDYMLDIGPPDTRDETEAKLDTEDEEDDIRPGKKLTYFETLSILKTRKVNILNELIYGIINISIEYIILYITTFSLPLFY